MDDAVKIKERIVDLINKEGPILPIKISKEIGLSLLFSSAFLSELLSERKIKMTSMRVGNSPLYFIEGQEPKLENFTFYLKGKEKEAFLKLKELRFLVDEEQEPAIRVALRNLKDFAHPFKHNDKLIWGYYLEDINDFSFNKTKESLDYKEKTKDKEVKENRDEKEVDEEKKEIKKKKIIKEKTKDKKTENFFNLIKEFLKHENLEIVDIIDFKLEEAFLRVKKDNEETIFIFLNTKKISEKEVTELSKKANNLGIKEEYEIYFFGSMLKRTQELITSIKRIKKIGKIE